MTISDGQFPPDSTLQNVRIGKMLLSFADQGEGPPVAGLWVALFSIQHRLA